MTDQTDRSPFNTALTIAPQPETREAATADAWVRHYAAQHQAAIADGSVSDHLGAPQPVSHHMARGEGPSEIEATCPCPKAPCGCVDTRRTDPACPHHPAAQCKTMRHMHRADRCPANNPANTTREG